MKRTFIPLLISYFSFFYLGIANCQNKIDTLVLVYYGYEKISKVGDTLVERIYATPLDSNGLEVQPYHNEFEWVKAVPYDKNGTMSIYYFNKENKLIWEKCYLGTNNVLYKKGMGYDPEKDTASINFVYYFEQLAHGLWKYWDVNGRLEKIEMYDKGALILSKEMPKK